MKNKKKILFILPLLILICLFVFRKQIFTTREIIQLFPLDGTEYLQLDSKGEKTWLRKMDWQTNQTLWKTVVPKAAYDTNSYSGGWFSPYTVTTEDVFVYRFFRNFPIPHRKSEAVSFQWAVRLETGELLWQRRFPIEERDFNFHLGSIQTAENVLVNFSNDEKDYYALYIDFIDMQTGGIITDSSLSIDMAGFGYPEVIGTNLLLQDSESFYMLDTKNGRTVHSEKQFGHGFYYPPEDTFFYISRNNRVAGYSLANHKESILGDQNYNPFWNSALYEGDIISITNNGEHESGQGCEIRRIDPESGQILWRSVISDDYNVNSTKQIAQALPYGDSWMYPVGPFAPLILKKRIEGINDLSKIAVLDLRTGDVVQKGEPRQLSDTALFMDEIVQIDDLIYINTGDDWTLLVFDPKKGQFLKALTIVYQDEDRESIVFPWTSLERHWGEYPVRNGKIYIGSGDWKCIVDLTTAEMVYYSTPKVKVIDKTEEFLNKYGL